jgi:transposase
VEKSQKSGSPKQSSERLFKEIRRATRCRQSAEDKIRVVLDGPCAEHNIPELGRRKGGLAPKPSPGVG